jgi:hypothetical protein
MRLAQIVTCFYVQLTVQRQLETACTTPCQPKKDNNEQQAGRVAYLMMWFNGVRTVMTFSINMKA